MAKHRRGRRSGMAALPLPELTAICVELRRRMPATPAEWVDVAVRDAMDALSGLDTAPHHVSALVRRRAEATLGESASRTDSG